MTVRQKKTPLPELPPKKITLLTPCIVINEDDYYGYIWSIAHARTKVVEEITYPTLAECLHHAVRHLPRHTSDVGIRYLGVSLGKFQAADLKTYGPMISHLLVELYQALLQNQKILTATPTP